MVLKFNGHEPKIDGDAFVAENATLIGEIEIKKGASVWFSAVLRGDCGKITLGEGSNVQDNATVHCDTGTEANIGANVTIGHNAIVHGAILDDNVMVGMGATILNNAHIGKNSIVGAGALVPENMIVPENSVVVGVPAKVLKQTSEKQVAYIRENAAHYVELGAEYKKLQK